MTTQPTQGHDGPYPTPIVVTGRSVLPEWIDYNGHMNVAYYGLAFDNAIDQMFDDHIGNGEAYVRAAAQGMFVLQSNMQFLQELRLGQVFSVSFQLIDHDTKRLHFWSEILLDGQVCATQEVLAMHVDLTTKRSAVFPDWLQTRLARLQADHATLARPERLGAKLGIRRG